MIGSPLNSIEDYDAIKSFFSIYLFLGPKFYMGYRFFLRAFVTIYNQTRYSRQCFQGLATASLSAYARCGA